MKRVITSTLSLIIVFTSVLLASGCYSDRKASSDPVTLTIWHVYGAQTDSPLNDLIDEFNSTVGKEEGIQVEVTMVSNNNSIHEHVLASANEEPGSSELPDIFCSYPKTVLALPDDDINALVQSVIAAQSSKLNLLDKKAQIEQARNRLKMIDRMITKMYLDNAEGKISDDRLSRVVADLEKEAGVLEAKIAELDVEDPTDEIQENYERFFALAKQYTYIETLDRDTLVTFIDRIEIGEKILPEGYMKMPRKNASYQQSIRIFYKFIGELVSEPVKEFAPNGQIPSTVPVLGEFNM